MTVPEIIGCAFLYMSVGMLMGAILAPADELTFIALWPLFVVVAIVIGTFRLFKDMVNE
jgi:hypothetical protein